MRVLIKATVVNTKGKKFDVRGALWDDGTFYVKNPRPKRYPEYIGLGYKPDSANEDEPRRLFWLRDLTDLDKEKPGKLSRFSIRSMLLDPKPPKARKKKKTP